MKVSWTPPDVDGGTPILGYFVEYKRLSYTEWTMVNQNYLTSTSIVVNNLHENNQYKFRVVAKNRIGLGSFSTPSDLYNTLGDFTVSFCTFLSVFHLFLKKKKEKNRNKQTKKKKKKKKKLNV